MTLLMGHGRQHGIPLWDLEQPLPITALDGRALGTGSVNRITAPVRLHTVLNHQEVVQFHEISSPDLPIVLGYPWLARHNPSLCWTTGTLLAWGERCQSTCLLDQSPPDVPERVPPADLSLVPVVYRDLEAVFSKTRSLLLPPHREFDCAIELLPGTMPPRGRVFSLSSPEHKAMEDYIAEALAAGFIRPSTSPAGAGFFFVEKNTGGLRPCIDYRGLNKITVKNRYPLPLMSTAFERLQGASWFTKLDLRSAYNLVRIRAGDEWKTAFNTPNGHYEYLVMPFGLTNAPAVFQALINHVLQDFLDLFVHVYLDDILIFSASEGEHIQHVRLVLQRLLQNRLYVKPEKCAFHVNQVSPDPAGVQDAPHGVGRTPVNDSGRRRRIWRGTQRAGKDRFQAGNMEYWVDFE